MKIYLNLMGQSRKTSYILFYMLPYVVCMYLQYSFFAIREKYNPRTIFVYGTEQNNYIISDMSEKDCMSNFLDL